MNVEKTGRIFHCQNFNCIKSITGTTGSELLGRKISLLRNRQRMNRRLLESFRQQNDFTGTDDGCVCNFLSKSFLAVEGTQGKTTPNLRKRIKEI